MKWERKIHTNLNKLAGRYQDGKQDAFLELNFPFQQGNWILVDFATIKIKKHFIGVILSVTEGETTVKFTGRVECSSMFVLSQTDDICEIDSEGIAAFFPEPI